MDGSDPRGTGFAEIEADCVTERKTSGSVTYTDKKGQSHTISCDSIVACGGMQAAQDEALTFADVVDTFIIIGDNEGTGNVMAATRSAYAAAMRI